MPPDGEVPDLRVPGAVQKPALDQGPDADASADGDVGDVAEPCSGAPALLGQGGCTDVRVECCGCLGGGTHGVEQASAAPARLGCGADGPVRRRGGVEVDRSESADAYGVDRAVTHLVGDDVGDGAQRLLGGGGRDRLDVDQVER